jgi:hypothetical protein
MLSRRLPVLLVFSRSDSAVDDSLLIISLLVPSLIDTKLLKSSQHRANTVYPIPKGCTRILLGRQQGIWPLQRAEHFHVGV